MLIFFNVNVQIHVHVLLNLIFSFVMGNPILHLKKAVMDDKQIITTLKKDVNNQYGCKRENH